MKDYTLEKKIEISNRINYAANILISAAVTLVIGTMLFKLLWSWTIPEIFSAAVEQGLILGDITWLAVLKIAVLFAILTSTGSLIAQRWK